MRFDYLSQVGYDLNLTRGCHRFYYLAPLQVLDPIYLRPDLGQAQQCDGVKLINGDPKLTSCNKIKQDFNFTILKGFKIIKLTTCDRFYNKKKSCTFYGV
jgi:hypothetical protein